METYTNQSQLRIKVEVASIKSIIKVFSLVECLKCKIEEESTRLWTAKKLISSANKV